MTSLHPSLITRNDALLLALALLGCEPLPENVGEGLSTSDESSSSSGTPTTTDDQEDGSSDGAPVEPPLEWELLLPDMGCGDVDVMPDGGVIVRVGDTLHRYTADGTLVWERPPGTQSTVLATLSDGRIVVGGSIDADPQRAVLWVLSPEGDVQATHVPPRLEDPEERTWVSRLDVDASGVAFVVSAMDSGGSPSRDALSLAGLDLVPQWWRTDFSLELGNSIWSVQLAASGSVRTIEFAGGDESRMRTFSATGDVESEEPRARIAAFAKGDPGVLYELVDGGVHLQGLDELPGLDAFFASGDHFPDAYHRDGIFLGRTLPLWVAQLDPEDGAPLYQEQLLDSMATMDGVLWSIAPGPDDSVYFCGSRADIDEGGEIHVKGFLLRRFPLA